MTNTPTPRPDVEGIEARATHNALTDWCPQHGVYDFCTQDIPALIAHIEALEARQEKLEAALKELSKGGGGYSMSQIALAALDSPEEQKAMEAGDG